MLTCPRPSSPTDDQVADLQRRLTEKPVTTLRFEAQQLSLDRAHRLRRHIAIAGRQSLGVISAIDEHLLQVLQVQQQQALIVGHPEGDVQYAFLRFVQAQQARQQQRPHFRNGGANRVPLLAEQIPEHYGVVGICQLTEPDIGGPFYQIFMRLVHRRSGHCHAGKIALHISHEHRNAGAAETLGHDLQCHGLAGPCGACDQAMPVGALQHHCLRCLAAGFGPDEKAALLVCAVPHAAPVSLPFRKTGSGLSSAFHAVIGSSRQQTG
jgi:hypothetical protein